MNIDLISLVIGLVTGALLGGLIPVSTWFLQAKREREDLKIFMGFVNNENEVKARGQKTFWWNPPLSQKRYHRVLGRMVLKGLLVYELENGYRLKNPT